LGFKARYQVKSATKLVVMYGLYNRKANQRKLEKRQETRMDGIFLDRDELKPGCKAEIQHPVKKCEQGIGMAHDGQRPVG